MKKKILLFIEDTFRDEEAVYPYYRFIEAGYDVKVVGPEANKTLYRKIRTSHGIRSFAGSGRPG